MKDQFWSTLKGISFALGNKEKYGVCPVHIKLFARRSVSMKATFTSSASIGAA